MAMFYGMINIAAVNALVIHAHNMPEKIKRKDFLLRNAHDLVTPFLTQYKLPTLPRNIKTASHVRICL
jgi:hypothetical protein